ncbi:GyrI-like domain-containing protein [Paenibacillus sp. NFR01]|uniref:AraC family transcriptional regulator n=1 Tax=Paenibacillus sp. NFR01 TaxID=1566279 RepID=UPI0008D50EEC|nr:AraC family transcriptional regulator [Paenibacillus sp. NFR01]SEU28050.1 AraC family transcriptional regulator [Paenibacillus sp. NFR01]
MNNDYAERIGKVIQYMKDNSHQKLSLDQLAAVANFSKYHFSRIFAAMTGMAPVAFLNRERLQRAVSLLAESDGTILEIAGQCGFDSVSAFNALFRKHYGLTPSEVRKSLHHNSKNPALLSNSREEPSAPRTYNEDETNHLLRRAWGKMITFKELPDVEVACVRHVGSYLDTGGAWEKLGIWAARHGFTPERQCFIGISLDDLDMVEEQACRYDACVTLPPGFEKQGHSGEVEFKTLTGGLYAMYPYYGPVDQFVLAYQHVFGLWLPESGYEADDKPCLEFCMNNPALDPEGKCKVDLYIPVMKRNG